MSMSKQNQDANETALQATIMARKNAILVGPPGVGKSARIRQLAKQMGYDMKTIVGSRMDPTDVSGVPSVQELWRNEYDEPVYGTVYAMPDWQQFCLRRRKVILFLDEWSNTPASVQASMLTVMQEREFPNGEKMPDETVIIAAMNPTSQAADGYEMAMPTTNRFTFLHWSPPVDAWFEGMLNAWGEDVSKDHMKWNRRIVGFLQENPGRLHVEPSDDLGSDGAYAHLESANDSAMEVFRSAWASRRSWDNVGAILANIPEKNIMAQDRILQGTVGYAAASDFRDWLRQNDGMDPREVLNDPSAVDWMDVTVDDANMVLRSILSMMDADNSTQVLMVFKAIGEAGRKDLGASYLTEALQKASGNGVPLEKQRENKRLMMEIMPMFRKTGQAKY